ncbi:MAG: YbhB/YbcL family Raf kinase inhibitor-like protein [Myxococcota bacterium]
MKPVVVAVCCLSGLACGDDSGADTTGRDTSGSDGTQTTEGSTFDAGSETSNGTGAAEGTDTAGDSEGTVGADTTEGVGTTGSVEFQVTSSAFTEGGTIPQPHECGPPLSPDGPGDDVSPDLTWTPGPAETQSYAVVVRDIDATIPAFPEGIIHWVIYDIPADGLSLPEGVAPGYDVSGAHQAELQGSGYFGYFGPCSPTTVNTYVFTVHAMPDPTIAGVTMASSESEIAAMIESSSIAQTSLSGES